MFIKQIDEKTALELAAKGREVMVLVPGEKEPKWEGMVPDTLQKMLEGCMFFRRGRRWRKAGLNEQGNYHSGYAEKLHGM